MARALRTAIAERERFASEPKVDGVRGLLAFDDNFRGMHNRRGERRDWLRGDEFEAGLRRLTARLPILTRGTVLDGELTTGRFGSTMSALMGSKRHRSHLRFVVFDVPVLAGVDLRALRWQDRRERLELLAQAFDVPLELSPLVEAEEGVRGWGADDVIAPGQFANSTDGCHGLPSDSERRMFSAVDPGLTAEALGPPHQDIDGGRRATRS